MSEPNTPPAEIAPSISIAISMVKLPVTDFAKARAFYRDVLGLTEEFAVDEYGWAQYTAGEVPLCLYVTGKGGGDGKPGGERDFHLATDDATAVHAAIIARGGEAVISCPPVKSADGGMFFMVRDPDGNTFKIAQR